MSALRVVVANDSTMAVFAGHLDITALGGAGFASQRTVDDAFRPQLDLSGYDGLLLDVDLSRTDDRMYTLVLKDTVLPKRPDGREQSSISWEIGFSVAAPGTATSSPEGGDAGQVQLLFRDFKATYRGKPVDEPEAPLDLGGIKRVALMVRSFFGEQEGDFALGLKSVAATRGSS